MKIVGAVDVAHEATLAKFADAFGLSRVEYSEDLSEMIIERGKQKWRIFATNYQNMEAVHVEKLA